MASLHASLLTKSTSSSPMRSCLILVRWSCLTTWKSTSKFNIFHEIGNFHGSFGRPWSFPPTGHAPYIRLPEQTNVSSSLRYTKIDSWDSRRKPPCLSHPNQCHQKRSPETLNFACQMQSLKLETDWEFWTILIPATLHYSWSPARHLDTIPSLVASLLKHSRHKTLTSVLDSLEIFSCTNCRSLSQKSKVFSRRKGSPWFPFLQCQSCWWRQAMAGEEIESWHEGKVEVCQGSLSCGSLSKPICWYAWETHEASLVHSHPKASDSQDSQDSHWFHEKIHEFSWGLHKFASWVGDPWV